MGLERKSEASAAGERTFAEAVIPNFIQVSSLRAHASPL